MRRQRVRRKVKRGGERESEWLLHILILVWVILGAIAVIVGHA